VVIFMMAKLLRMAEVWRISGNRSWLLGEEVSLEVGVETLVSFFEKCSGAIYRTKLNFHCRINPTVTRSLLQVFVAVGNRSFTPSCRPLAFFSPF